MAGIDTQMLQGTQEVPAELSVEGPSELTSNTTAEYHIRIDSAVPVYGIEFTLTEPAGEVSLTGLSSGSFLSQNGNTVTIVNRIEGQTAKYGETRINVDNGVTGTGLVATVSITVPDTMPNPQFTLALTEVTLADPDAEVIATKTTNQTVSVTDVTTPTPTQVATPTPNTEPQQPSDRDSTTEVPDQSTAVETAESTTTVSPTSTAGTTAEWQQKVDAEVRTQTSESDSVPVIVQLEQTSNLSRATAQLRAAGVTGATANVGLRVVTGSVSDTDLSQVAAMEHVERVRLDTRARVQQTNETPSARSSSATTASPTSAADGNSGTETRTPASDRTPARGTMTAASGPGFGVILAIISIAVALLGASRRTELK